MSDFESMLEVYRISFLQDAATLLKEMRKRGVSVDDFIRIVKQKFSNVQSVSYENFRRQQILRQEYFAKTRRCALCGSPMHLYQVNDSKCTQVGGNWQSMWQCADVMGCGETVFSTQPIHIESETYGMQKFFLTQDEIRERRNRRRANAVRRTSNRRTSMAASPDKRPCGGRK